MPLLNIDELMGDPDFASEGLTVLRSTSVMGRDGIPQVFKNSYPLTAIVTPMRATELQRMPEGFNSGGAINLITDMTLYAGDARRNINADQVIWKGALYLVKAVDDYTEWGGGFVQAFCELQGINAP